MLKRRDVAIYLGLFVMGCLLILASQLVRPGDDPQRRTELALLISNAQSIKAESEGLLGQLRDTGEGDPEFLANSLTTNSSSKVSTHESGNWSVSYLLRYWKNSGESGVRPRPS